jgi:hypothetical protein
MKFFSVDNLEGLAIALVVSYLMTLDVTLYKILGYSTIIYGLSVINTRLIILQKTLDEKS